MKRQAFALVAAALVIAGLVHAGDDGKGDLKAIQGTWTAGLEGKKVNLTFSGSKFSIDFDGKTFKGSFRLDPTKKPKAIDLSIEDGPEKEVVGKTSLGIYAFDGDQLKWCGGEPGESKRPADFPAKEGDGPGGLYLIMKKAK